MFQALRARIVAYLNSEARLGDFFFLIPTCHKSDENSGSDQINESALKVCCRLGAL